ncbi:piggyBac transposable element-derived protein 4-like [Anthonomus grandis grandis]|uniref:piggyBac transposable element-derived protein 4-like n=1 Tax=Anthonomus grandis grandis TaxID=2921223 RepID=UPI002165D3B6|nr:piggyBac transposable element-derived protein 4-like [Anthonomus grandis grandis]
MGGVDLTDHLAGLYEFDRKSTKWWKQVFYKLLMITAVNSFIIYNEVRRKKIPFLEFLIALAESLIDQGKSKAGVKRRSTTGRPSTRQKTMVNVGDHMPIVEQKRRRCIRCSQNKMEKRTRTVCQGNQSHTFILSI